MHKEVCCGEAEAWRKEILESLVTTFKSNHYPEVPGPNAPFLCSVVLALPMRKSKHWILPCQDTCDLYPLCISLWVYRERKGGLILKWNIKSLKPRMFQNVSAQGFLDFTSLYIQNEICFTLWCRLWQHVSTDIKVSMPLGSSALFLILEMVRVASSSFMERCKWICCPSLQGKGGELEIFCHIPPVSSWCTISNTILQIENLCLYYLTCQHPDRSSSAMLTFCIEWSLFLHVQETS